jgi:hypothetical protein
MGSILGQAQDHRKRNRDCSPASGRKGQERDLLGAREPAKQRECEIDTVTRLDPFERFVFVMERLSIWDCALFLGCGMTKIAQARMKALRRLPDLAALLAQGDGLRMRRLVYVLGVKA